MFAPGVAVVRGVGQRADAAGVEHHHERAAQLGYLDPVVRASDARTRANTGYAAPLNRPVGAYSSSTSSSRPP